MREYENQNEIDELRKAIALIDPGIKLQEFDLFPGTNRVKKAIIHLDEKGNKPLIDKLISIGFKKKARHRKRVDVHMLLSTPDAYVVRLEMEL